MFLYGEIRIDPQTPSQIVEVEPAGGFAKFIHAVSSGWNTQRQEHEQMDAHQLVGQLHQVLTQANLRNVIRLTKDRIDFYNDKRGKPEDLDVAIDRYNRQSGNPVFDTLELVLEQDQDVLHSYVHISVNRIHAVGVKPIVMKITSCYLPFTQQPGESTEDVRARMEPYFANQPAYETVKNHFVGAFSQVIQVLEESFKIYLGVERMTVSGGPRILRPSEPISASRYMSDENNPFAGGFGFGPFVEMLISWPDMCVKGLIQIQDTMIVDENGKPIMVAGRKGFGAGKSSALKIGSPFAPPREDDVDYFPGNKFTTMLRQKNLIRGTSVFSINHLQYKL